MDFVSSTRTSCSISRDRKTGLITVQIDWRDAVKAARWGQYEIVARLNAEMRSRAIQSTNASVGYLEKSSPPRRPSTRVRRSTD